MSTTATQLTTAGEYAALPDNGLLTELVRGEIVELNQPTPRHGQICSWINRILGNFVDEHDLGHVVSNDTGILTQRNPDTVRGGDVWYVSYQKIHNGPLPSKYLAIPPDIVFDVLSPSNSRGGAAVQSRRVAAGRRRCRVRTRPRKLHRAPVFTRRPRRHPAGRRSALLSENTARLFRASPQVV